MIVFLQVVAGASTGFKELQTGRIRLKGDLALAMTIEEWFVG